MIQSEIGKSSGLKVTMFEPKYADAFYELNRHWIEQYFRMEPIDYEQLENPQSIVAAGGQVLFAVDSQGRALGTCAMVPEDTEGRVYELSKMAVAEEARGRGIGDVLMEAAKEWARERGAEVISITSNTVLAPAIRLYKKHGFVTVDEGIGISGDYERGNIRLKYRLP
jgi:GNAT superfamily N-acetyltransferase